MNAQQREVVKSHFSQLCKDMKYAIVASELELKGVISEVDKQLINSENRLEQEKNAALVRLLQVRDSGWESLLSSLDGNAQTYLGKLLRDSYISKLEHDVIAHENAMCKMRLTTEALKNDLKEKTAETEHLMKQTKPFATQIARLKMANEKMQIIVAGGWEGAESNKCISSVDIFNCTVRRWRQADFEIPQPPRSNFSAVSLNGRLYFFGGHDGSRSISNVDVFDISLGEWIKTTIEMPTARCESVVVPCDGRIYVIGGCELSQNCQTDFNDVFAFDPNANTKWSTLSSMVTPRSFFAVASLDSEIYAIGGNGGRAQVEKFNPKLNCWFAVPPLKTGRMEHVAVAVGKQIFAIGGRDENGNALKSGEVFSGSSWSFIAEMPTPRIAASAFVYAGLIYVVGGQSDAVGNDIQSSMDVYDSSSNSWTTSNIFMPNARSYAACTAFV